jgi:hypothetical protein
MARVVEQHLGAEHVGEDELGRAEDRAVDVRLGGEVDDRVDALGGACDRVGIFDRAVEEVVLDAFEVRAASRRTNCEPMNPAPPVTSTRIARKPNEESSAFG